MFWNEVQDNVKTESWYFQRIVISWASVWGTMIKWCKLLLRIISSFTSFGKLKNLTPKMCIITVRTEQITDCFLVLKFTGTFKNKVFFFCIYIKSTLSRWESNTLYINKLCINFNGLNIVLKTIKTFFKWFTGVLCW